MRAEGHPLSLPLEGATDPAPDYKQLFDRIEHAKYKGRKVKKLICKDKECSSVKKCAKRAFSVFLGISVFMILNYSCKNKNNPFCWHKNHPPHTDKPSVDPEVLPHIITDKIDPIPFQPLLKHKIIIQQETIPITLLEPCLVNFEYFKVSFNGGCTSEQMNEAFEESDRRIYEHEEQQKLAGKKLAKEMGDKWNEEKADLDEQVRRMSNRTDQELEDDMHEIHKKMDKKFKHRAGYIPRIDAPSVRSPLCPQSITNLEKYRDLTPSELTKIPEINPACKEHAELIFGIYDQSDYSDIKTKYRSLTLGYHPDKNKSEGSSDAFNLITTAYETLTA